MPHFSDSAGVIVVTVRQYYCRDRLRNDVKIPQIDCQSSSGTGIKEECPAVVVAAVYGKTMFCGKRRYGAVIHHDLKVPRHIYSFRSSPLQERYGLRLRKPLV